MITSGIFTQCYIIKETTYGQKVSQASYPGMVLYSYKGDVEYAPETKRFLRGDYSPSISKYAIGGYNYKGSLEFPLEIGDANSVGPVQFLYGILGNRATSTGVPQAGYNTYDMSLLNTNSVNSWNIFLYQANIGYLYKGCIFDNFKLSFKKENKTIDCSIDWVAQDREVLASLPTITYSTLSLLTPVNTTFLFNNSSNFYPTSLDITFSRDLEKINTLNNNRLLKGGLFKDFIFTVETELLDSDDGQFTKFLNNTELLDFKATVVLNATDPYKLTILCSKMLYTSYENPNAGGTDLISFKTVSQATTSPTGSVITTGTSS